MHILITVNSTDKCWKIQSKKIKRYKLLLMSLHGLHCFVFRYAPLYWMEMKNLEDSHPWVYENMMTSGNWTVQRSGKALFTSIAADQAIEQTVNRQSKTSGGVQGITLTRGISLLRHA